MFSKRKVLPSRRWDRAFIVELSSDLSRAGFSNIVVKLPHNLVGMDESEIVLQEFLDRERNYPSAIFVARNESTNETIKILFVNISRKAFFVDDTFPSGHSESTELFVQSPDPARTYALFHFFYEYMERSKAGLGSFILLLGILSFVLLAAEFVSLASTRKGLFDSRYGSGSWIDGVALVVAVIVQMAYFRASKGLFVKERQPFRIGSYVNMALRGELRDNPVVSIVVSVLASIATALILKWLGVV